MYRRKPNKGLTSKQRTLAYEAAHQAKRLGIPLTQRVTFTLDTKTASDHAAVADLFTKLRNKTAVEARRNGYTPACVWSIETKPDGSHPHMHMLVHVPADHKDGFIGTVTRWLPGGAVQLDDVDQDADPVGYITKQLDHQARWRPDGNHLPNFPSVFSGKRFGATGLLTKHLPVEQRTSLTRKPTRKRKPTARPKTSRAHRLKQAA